MTNTGLDNGDTTVLVTGATGFIARHVIAQALDAGYRVRGTVRKQSSLSVLTEALAGAVADPQSLERFSVVEADLLAERGWPEATSGCRFVLHVASPVPTKAPKDPDELIRPALEGTERVLRAALAAGVERFVYTSSVSAVVAGVARSRTFTPDDWTDLDAKGISAYERAKTLAERAAWRFIESEATGRMDLVVVNPGLVLGPMIGNDASTSLEAVRKLMAREVPGCPNLCVAPIDVRDVAAVHLAALASPTAAGQRYFAARESCVLRDLALILADYLEPKGFKIATRTIPTWLMRLVSVFDKTAAMALPDVDNPYQLDHSATVALLGRPFRPLDEIVRATADTLLEYNLVRPKKR